MDFPTLFPAGKIMFQQPRLKEIPMHEYTLHLMRYHDVHFGSHPRFRYFLLNLIMRHIIQSTIAIFMKQNIKSGIPTTIGDLRRQLLECPKDNLSDSLMWFGSSLRGTRSFWAKNKSELSDMVDQLGTPTLFFTRSAVDTKWPDLHSIMYGECPTDP